MARDESSAATRRNLLRLRLQRTASFGQTTGILLGGVDQKGKKRWCRDWLDPFFVYSTYLGTHRFFLLALPALFWFGQEDLARGLVVVLATGVYLSGVLKDTACLPRPAWSGIRRPELLGRSSQQGSIMKEFGFPSTHATNSLTIALLLCSHFDLWQCWPALLGLALYVWNICFGRIYCGMHGWVDVLSGLGLGGAVWVFWLLGWCRLEAWFLSAGLEAPLLGAGLAIGLVLLHPVQPPCPCFEDSVAFVAAGLGVLIGCWQTSAPIIPTNPLLAPLRSILLLSLGVTCVLTWRKLAKFGLKLICKADLAIQLMVYTGIGWLASKGVPSLALWLGLINQ